MAADHSRQQANHINRHLLRMTRFMLAAFSSVVICSLLGALYWLGAIERHVTFTGVLLILGSVALFFLAFLSGLNRRASDPSLTVHMTTAAVLVLLYIMYISVVARETFVSFFGVLLLFAVFRFPTRVLLLHACLILLGYGVVLALTWRNARAGTSHSIDIARWLTLATVLPLFTLIGGQIMSGRRAAMQKLSSSEERFRRLTDLSSDWYWEQDAGLRFSMISSGLKSIAGIAPENLIGKNIKEITSGVRHNDWDALRMAMESFEPFTNFEGRARDDNGTVRWLSVSGAPLFDAAGVFSGYYGTGRDITGRKQIEELVQFQAHHDALTGLPNRTLLNERLELMIARAASDHHEIWVLFLDLDRFKRINDSLGHKIGDVLLQQISQRMHAVLRKTDIIARLGGDEFVLALSDVETGSQSFSLLQHIMEAASAPVMIGDSELATSCSVGIAVYPSDGATADVLIEHADIAMYRAKETGRNNYQFYKPEMNERAMDRLRLESDLRNALQDDEFVLHYQPQIDLVTNEIVGVEALLRWRHPTSGLLGPAQFIGVAEDIGLIMPIGDWVLREACSQATHWLKNGYPPIRVAVNLSARQFAHQNLVHSVSSALQSSGLDGNLLEIEITESLMMSNMEQTVNILRELKSLGVHVSVDDFGTGYSSLYYLKRFPIDVLKIDRSFVRDITIDPDDAAIVSAIISLAHNLGLRVTAEGVEQQDQLDYLAHYGCDVVQGYLFSRPIDAGAFESLLSQGILWAHECMTARSQYAHGPGGHNQCSYCSQCGTS